MRILYDIFFLLFGFLYIPYLLIKGKLHRGFSQKFGNLPADVINVKSPVWIHAVSVGEAVLAAKIASRIKTKIPRLGIVVSTTTRTGNEMIRSKGKGVVDAVFYFPFDLRAVVSRVAALISPALYIMMETELWPNLLGELHSRGVPVVLANGRISDASFRNYRRIGFIVRRILDNVDFFCMQSEKSAERIKTLGAPENRVHVTGNMKFDEVSRSPGSRNYSKKDFGFNEDDKVIVAGSTHFFEEQDVIDVYKNLKEKYTDLKLILAPRHVERADAVEMYVVTSGMKYCRFSQLFAGGSLPASSDVVLVDTIGHLKDIYRLATVIFMGGSLVRKGGQNPIEGARLGKAVVFGPHMFNFREVAEIFVEGKAAIKVSGKSELGLVLDDLLENEDKRRRIASNAERIVKENSGAVDRTLEIIGTVVK